MAVNPRLKTKANFKELKKLAERSPSIFERSFSKAGIQMLTWMNNGSSNESRKPPIRWGVLRGSSTVFIGNKLVETYKSQIKPGAPDKPTPAKSHSAPPLNLTWVWNTDYATRMHEWTGNWGPFTQQDGDAGNKWVEKHLEADRNALIEMTKTEFQKEVDRLG